MALWDKAVQRVLEEPPPADAMELLRNELENLWSDLDQAIHYALNGQWSMGCGWFTERIVTITQRVGVTPWEKVPMTLLLSETYQGIMTSAGYTVPEIDLEELRDLVEQTNGGNRPL